MKSMFRKGGLLLAGGLLMAAAGCSVEASALAKLQSGRIGDLTAAEWKALSHLGPSFGYEVDPLTDEQAQAIVELLDLNGIDTIDDLDVALHAGTIEIPYSIYYLFYPPPDAEAG